MSAGADDPGWLDEASSRSVVTAAECATAVSSARRIAAEHLGSCGCTSVDDAVLVLSELVTNAVLHGGGAQRIVVACDRQWIRITVLDRVATELGPAAVPSVGAPLPATLSVGGRGLRIVEQLSERWGCTPRPGGKLVWAMLPRAGAAGTDASA